MSQLIPVHVLSTVLKSKSDPPSCTAVTVQKKQMLIHNGVIGQWPPVCISMALFEIFCHYDHYSEKKLKMVNQLFDTDRPAKFTCMKYAGLLPFKRAKDSSRTCSSGTKKVKHFSGNVFCGWLQLMCRQKIYMKLSHSV